MRSGTANPLARCDCRRAALYRIRARTPSSTAEPSTPGVLHEIPPRRVCPVRPRPSFRRAADLRHLRRDRDSIPLAEHVDDLVGPHAGGDQEEFAGDLIVEHTLRGFGDRDAPREVVVERRGEFAPLEAKDDVDTRRLDVSVNDTDALPFGRK